jgi:glycosyltransferase involved in cell wall biosynthesis
MHICHVTAHLPPDQAANALLPFHLGRWAQDAGDTVSYVAYPPRAVGPPSPGALRQAAGNLPGPVAWLPQRQQASGVARLLRLSSLAHAADIRRTARPLFAAADVIHVHSNGLLPEVAALHAVALGKPVVLTLYGTEVWHYRRRVFPPQLFARMYHRASRVTFYSQGLLDRARELGLGRDGLSVVYPPVAPYFTRQDEPARTEARRQLGLTRRHVLVNVKRLHPLAGQRYLLDALPAVLAAHPDTQLVFCGTGPLADALRQHAAHLGVADHVTFAGLVDNQRVALFYAAADVFVLPSLLEACPTVAVEALASGTPVVSTDNPGGIELGRLFGDDVQVVPREDAARLADAVVAALRHTRRTRPSTDDVLGREFSPAVSAGRFHALYRSLATPVPAR